MEGMVVDEKGLLLNGGVGETVECWDLVGRHAKIFQKRQRRFGSSHLRDVVQRQHKHEGNRMNA